MNYAVLATVAIGVVTMLISVVVGREWLTSDPLALALWTVMGLSFGAATGVAFSKESYLKAKEREETKRAKIHEDAETERMAINRKLDAEEKKAQEKAAAEAERTRQHECDRRAALALDVRNKALLKAASEYEVYCSSGSHPHLDSRFVSGFFDLETVEAFKTRMHLNDKAKRWLADYPDTFAVIDEDEVMRHAVFDKTEQRNPGDDWETAGMGWWWYSHDEEPSPERLRELRRHTTIYGHFDSQQWV